MPLSQSYETLEKDIQNLQSNITQILSSGCHYTTPEITNYIKIINNALDNVKLDYELLRESKDCSKQSNPNEMKSNAISLKPIIDKGNELSQQLNNRLHTVEIRKKEHNQIRETHNWACDSLRDYLQSIQPYASSSYARLDNIAHHLGVTDRYIGYRNNLTRSGNQPLNVHTIWADRKLPQASTPDWQEWTHIFQHNNSPEQIFEKLANSNQNILDNMEATQSTETQHRNKIKATKPQSFVYANDYETHLKKAGLNLNSPGTTEFTDSFTTPDEPPASPPLTIAQPDYTLTGRPLAHLEPATISTEYTKNFKHPNTARVEKFPWLRP